MKSEEQQQFQIEPVDLKELLRDDLDTNFALD